MNRLDFHHFTKKRDLRIHQVSQKCRLSSGSKLISSLSQSLCFLSSPLNLLQVPDLCLLDHTVIYKGHTSTLWRSDMFGFVRTCLKLVRSEQPRQDSVTCWTLTPQFWWSQLRENTSISCWICSYFTCRSAIIWFQVSASFIKECGHYRSCWGY